MTVLIGNRRALLAGQKPLWVPAGGLFAVDFANNRSWTGRVSGAAAAPLACSRASAGFYTKSDLTLFSYGSNVLRYDTATGLLLVEPARTNVIPHSQDQTDAAYTKDQAAVTGAAAVAPDGTTTACLVVPNTANAPHRIYNNLASVTPAAAGFFSCFAKASGYSQVAIRENFIAGNYAVFGLSGAGSVLGTSAGAATITALGNGWYYLTWIYTSTLAMTFGFYVMNGWTSGNPQTYNFVGDGTSGAYIWQMDLHSSITITSPIATVASSATRAADAVSMTLPAGVGNVDFTFDDNSTQTVAGASGSFSIPTNLNRPYLKSLVARA